MADLYSFLADPVERRTLVSNTLDAVNRGLVAGTLGAPVDLTNAVINLGKAGVGYVGHELGFLSPSQMPQIDDMPIGGSEWIAQKMQQAGLLGGYRNPMAEAFSGGLLGPGITARTAQAPQLVGGLLGAAETAAARPPKGYWHKERGAIDASGLAQLIDELKTGQTAGEFRLGDVTPGQAKRLADAVNATVTSRDVVLKPDDFWHLYSRRVQQDGFTPEEVGEFAKRAMEPRAEVMIDPASTHQQASLINRGAIDPATGKRYDATMPLRVGDDEDVFELVTVVPRGLRKKNPPRD